MRTFFSAFLVVTFLSIFSFPAQAELKISVVDLQQVFKEYHKTKEADTQLKDLLSNFQKEYQEMMADYQKMVEEAGKLRDDANNQTLSEKVRKEKTKVLQQKIQEVKNYERKLREFDMTRRRQLDDQSGRKRKKIIEDIEKVVAEIGKAKKLNLIVDSSGLTLNGTAAILYTEGLPNITEEVVAKINAEEKKKVE